MPYWKDKGHFSNFPRQSVNCYGQDNRGCCEYRLPEKTLDFPFRNRVTMQARSRELWWSTLADDSISEQHLFVPKHVTLSQKMRVALLVSIPLALLTSSELLSCVQGADMSIPTCASENSQLDRTECLESSRQGTDRGKLQGVCGKD